MKILLPVDGSAHSDAAIDFLAGRSAFGASVPAITLLNVQPKISARVARAVGRTAARELLRQMAEDVLRPALARLQSAGLAARTNYALGGGPDAIARAAVRGRFNLIVMGSRGHSPLKGLLFGSMTYSVLAACTTPLLLVRSGETKTKQSLDIGIAVDGSKYGLEAARWALAHRDLFGAAPVFQVIHALPGDGTDDSGTTTSARAMRPVRTLFARAGLEPKAILLRSEKAADAIAAHAIKAQLDMLVLGSHGRGALKSLVLGSVAMRVAAKWSKPLLFIREPVGPLR